MANEKFEQWKEKVGYDFEHLDPKVINADLQCEKPTSYDFSRVGYQAGRKDGVKEVLRPSKIYSIHRKRRNLLHRRFFRFY